MREIIEELSLLYKYERELTVQLGMKAEISCIGFKFQKRGDGVVMREHPDGSRTFEMGCNDIKISDINEQFGWRAMEYFRELMRERIGKLEKKLKEV